MKNYLRFTTEQTRKILYECQNRIYHNKQTRTYRFVGTWIEFSFFFLCFFLSSKCMITHWSDDKLDVTQIEIGLLRTQGTLNHRQSSLWITDYVIQSAFIGMVGC